MPKPTAKWYLNDHDKAEYVRIRLDDWKKLYDVGQNPKFAWLAYSLVREAGFEIPEL